MSTTTSTGGNPVTQSQQSSDNILNRHTRSGSTASSDISVSSSSGVHSRTGSSSAKTGGFFHSVKKAFSGTKHDNDNTIAYEVAGTPTNPELTGFSHGFTGLQTDTNKLKHYINLYHSHFNGLLESSKAIFDILDRLLHSTEPDHVNLANELRNKHTLLYNTLVSNSSVNPVELHSDTKYQQHTNNVKSILTSTEIELDNIVDYHTAIQQRIQQRNGLASEVEYYSKKFHTLQDERTKRAAASKVEKPADAEKFDRNQRKLTDVRQEYLDASAAITEELRALLNARGQTYGRALIQLSNAEREIGNTLAHINTVTIDKNVPDVVPAQPPAIVSNSNAYIRTNVDIAPVNQELPSQTPSTQTVVSSGATRATDGTELLSKNQIIQPPSNADQYNTTHPYNEQGQFNNDIENKPITGVDPTHAYQTQDQTTVQTKLAAHSDGNTSSANDDEIRPSTTSYNTGNAINTAASTSHNQNNERTSEPIVTEQIDTKGAVEPATSNITTDNNNSNTSSNTFSNEQDVYRSSADNNITTDHNNTSFTESVKSKMQDIGASVSNKIHATVDDGSNASVSVKSQQTPIVIRDATPADLERHNIQLQPSTGLTGVQPIDSGNTTWSTTPITSSSTTTNSTNTHNNNIESTSSSNSTGHNTSSASDTLREIANAEQNPINRVEGEAEDGTNTSTNISSGVPTELIDNSSVNNVTSNDSTESTASGVTTENDTTTAADHQQEQAHQPGLFGKVVSKILG